MSLLIGEYNKVMKLHFLLSLLLCYICVGSSCDYLVPSSSNPKKRYEFIPEDSSWRLEKIYADANKKPRIAVVSHYTLDEVNLDFIKRAIKNHEEYAKQNRYDYYFRNGTIKGSEKYFWPEAEGRTFQLGLYWQKILAVNELLDKKENGKRVYDYVLWIDADAIFTRPKLTLESFIDEADPDTFLFIAEDINSHSPLVMRSCVNTGVFMVKNSDKGREFMQWVDDAFEIYKVLKIPEQSAVQDLAHKGFLKHEEISPLLADKKKLEEFRANIRWRDCSADMIDGVKKLPMKLFNAGYHWSDLDTISWDETSFVAHFLALDGGAVSRYMNILVTCLEKYGYEHRERCHPTRLNIILENTDSKKRR